MEYGSDNFGFEIIKIIVVHIQDMIGDILV